MIDGKEEEGGDRRKKLSAAGIGPADALGSQNRQSKRQNKNKIE